MVTGNNTGLVWFGLVGLAWLGISHRVIHHLLSSFSSSYTYRLITAPNSRTHILAGPPIVLFLPCPISSYFVFFGWIRHITYYLISFVLLSSESVIRYLVRYTSASDFICCVCLVCCARVINAVVWVFLYLCICLCMFG